MREQKARPVPELLREWAGWAAIRRRGDEVPLPVVVLHLRSGRDFQGVVQSLEDSTQGQYVLLEGEFGPTHIPVNAVEAITVRSNVVELTETAPTMLQFRRSLAKWEAELTAAFGVPIAVGFTGVADDLAALESLRGRLVSIFESFAREDLAKKDIAAKVKGLQLSTAEEPSAELSGGALKIATTREMVKRQSAAQLKSALEAAL